MRALTVLWVGAFVAALVLLESYGFRHDEAGKVLLTSQDRFELMKPVILIYSFYLAGILACWYKKPFKAGRAGKTRAFRFALALTCAIIWNAYVLYLIGYKHLFPTPDGGTVADYVTAARNVGLLLSFIVAPANFHYFGIAQTQRQKA
jgi:hypothetical protein